MSLRSPPSPWVPTNAWNSGAPSIGLLVFVDVRVLPFSVNALRAFRSAVACAVCSKKLPMTNTLVLLSLVDGLGALTQRSVGFRQLRLAFWLEEEGRLEGQLDYDSTGSCGHGPFICLLNRPGDVFPGISSRKAG